MHVLHMLYACPTHVLAHVLWICYDLFTEKLVHCTTAATLQYITFFDSHRSTKKLLLLYNYLFTVRLVGGSSYNEGRVEVYYKGVWGTVCNDGWNDVYAGLICTQLGFGSSGSLAYFGPGMGSIYLDNVICSANDTILANCGHYGVGITVNCDHSKDVGVMCIGMHSYL